MVKNINELYNETLEFINTKLPMFQKIGNKAYKANLENTILLDKYFNNPHKNFKTIHIAGTNGKGSVSHMLASVLQKANYKVGLFTSPHLFDFRERIKINGKIIEKEFVVNFINSNKKIIEKINPSFFEISVFLAFEYFKNNNIDIAIIETGLGGRLDSTNIITPELSIITNIGYDHTEILGNTLEEIAFEKAGIIKNNIPVIIGEKIKETSKVFESIANIKSSTLIYAEDKFHVVEVNTNYIDKLTVVFKNTDNQLITIDTDLTGHYQIINLRTVLTALKLLESKINVTKNDILQGLKMVKKSTGIVGRWDVLSKNPLIICDVAHNENGFKRVIEQIKNINYNNLHIILGFVKEKNVDKILEFCPVDATYYFTRPSIERGLCEKTLQQIAYEKNLKGKYYSNISDAYNDAKKTLKSGDLLLISGSIFLIADFYKTNLLKHDFYD